MQGAIYFKDRFQWRKWLAENHSTKKEVWLLQYKKHTRKRCVSYKESVGEALCFGWIDGKMKRIDDEKHMQRFSPRGLNSPWSKINKDLAIKLIKEGRMTPAGWEQIRIAKRNGNWKNAYTLKTEPLAPEDLVSSLKANGVAWENFEKFARGYKNMYISWVNDAKRSETRKNRIEKVTFLSASNKKSFM